MDLTATLWYVVVASVLCSLIPACYLDYTTRRVPLKWWAPAAYIGVPLSIILFVMKILSYEIYIGSVFLYVGTAMMLMVVAILLGYLNIFGGADAIALSLVALTSFSYMDPVRMDNPFFAFIFGGNLIICCAAMFLIILIMNVIEGSYKDVKGLKNTPLLFFARRIRPQRFKMHRSIVLEDVKEDVGGIIRRWFIATPMRLNEKAFEEFNSYKIADTEKYNLYLRLEKVWVMYLIPMIIPVTAAYILTVANFDIIYIFNHLHLVG
jgi:hypothetical protein